MKKNRMMRLASVLLVLTLLSTCAISGTFAKYTTSITGNDSARVAYWGFNGTNTDIAFNDLFSAKYVDEKVASSTDVTNTAVNSVTGTDVIAPGTKGSASFQFKYNDQNGFDAPEVAYKFTVSVEGSSCDAAIASNSNIKWKLDNGSWGTWSELLTSILKLSGNSNASYTTSNESASHEYVPQALPAAFTKNDDTHTVYWQWAFEDKSTFVSGTSVQATATDLDSKDTEMGNASSLANVKLVVKITATQVDKAASNSNV